MALRCSMHFRLLGQSWSEAWINPNFAAMNDAANQACSALAVARLSLCGGGVVLRRVTMSLEERPGTVLTTGDSTPVILPGQPEGVATEVPVEQVVPAAKNEIAADIPNTCLLLDVSDESGKYHKKVYIAGIPDAVIITRPVGPAIDAAGAWADRYKAYREALTKGGWGWWARRITGAGADPQQVVGFQQDSVAPNNWAVVTTQSGVRFEAHERVQLRGFKHYPCTPCPWQGIWVIDHVVETTGAVPYRQYFLKNSSGMDPKTVKYPGTIERVAYGFQKAVRFFLVKQATRKRGVGWNRPVGRSKPRRKCGVC